MTQDIQCPQCGHVFDIENVLAAELEKKIQLQYQHKLNDSLQKIEDDKKKFAVELAQFEEKKKNENELFLQKLNQEKTKMEAHLHIQLKESIAADYENRLQMLSTNNADNEEKLKIARKKELEYLQKEKELETKKAELEIEIEKKLAAERNQLTETIRRQETEKNSLKEQEFQMKMREMEKQLDDQKKLAEEMKRKVELRSQQLQGEVQETALEELLKQSFPFDIIEEVAKGTKGADCIQIVRNQFAQECGKIIYESKRTENFGADWIDKLKKDMLAQGADIAVIVTKTMPKDMPQFGDRQGVYICSFSEVKSVSNLLRNAVIKIADARKSQENAGKGRKSQKKTGKGRKGQEKQKKIRKTREK